MVTKRDAAQRIGFIGLGHMGRLMVARLLAAGYTLTVYDRTPERTRSLADKGAAQTDSSGRRARSLGSAV